MIDKKPTPEIWFSEISVLKQLYPPKKVLAVSANRSIKEEFETLLEGASIDLRTQEYNNKNQNINQNLSPDGQEKVFYTSSLSSESGFIRPETLKPIWKNIHTISEALVSTQRFEDVLKDCHPSHNWLVLDSLSAHALLASISCYDHLPDIIIAKAIDSKAVELDDQVTTIKQLEDLLNGYGFYQVSTRTTRHPNVIQAVFARDNVNVIKSKQKEIESQKVENSELSKKITNLENSLKEKESQNQKIDIYSKEIESQKKENLKLSKKITNLENSLRKLENSLKEKESQNQKIDNYSKEITSLKKSLESELEIKRTISTELKELKTKEKKLQSSLDASEINIHDLRKKYKSLIHELKNKNEIIEDIHASLSSAIAQLAEDQEN